MYLTKQTTDNMFLLFCTQFTIQVFSYLTLPPFSFVKLDKLFFKPTLVKRGSTRVMAVAFVQMMTTLRGALHHTQMNHLA